MRRAALCSLALAALVPISGVRLLVVEGESMAPAIRSGDLVVTAALPLSLFGEVGSIVLRSERRGASSGLLLHRVIERGAGWRRTAGDASTAPDIGRVADVDVHGLLIAVIPAAPLSHLLRNITGIVNAAFTAHAPVRVGLASIAGAPFALVSGTTSGGDGSGRLLPGGSNTSLLRLGWAGTATHTLRIDPVAYASSAASTTPNIKALARSLRITARCRDAADPTAPWWPAGDLLMARWSPTSLSTGKVVEADPALWPSGIECEVTSTLLGAIAAQSAVLQLPLLWGPL